VLTPGTLHLGDRVDSRPQVAPRSFVSSNSSNGVSLGASVRSDQDGFCNDASLLRFPGIGFDTSDIDFSAYKQAASRLACGNRRPHRTLRLSRPMSTTSPSLLDRLRQSQAQEAWEYFVELYTPMLLAWCRRLGLADADAADLTQSVFVVLCEKLPEFRYDPQRSFRSWLKTILLNTWRNQVRRRSARPSLGGEALADVEDTDPRLELDEAEYRVAIVRRALALMQERFEPATWKACWGFVVEGRPADEVARENGLTTNAVYLAKSRVLRQLRHELQGFLD
jgi:RNA polymerase sigma-70 factor, ECF subfamily